MPLYDIEMQTLLRMPECNASARYAEVNPTPPERVWKPWELLIAVVALVVSGFTLYRSELRGPDTRLTFGPLVYFLGTRIIGVNCSFTNDSPATDTLTYITAEIESPHEILKPLWLSVEGYRWTIEKGLQEHYTKQAEFSNFTPIVIQGKNRENHTLWFRSENRAFKFDSRDYRITLTAFGNGPEDRRTQATLVVPVSTDYLKLLQADDSQQVSIPIEPWVEMVK